MFNEREERELLSPLRDLGYHVYAAGENIISGDATELTPKDRLKAMFLMAFLGDAAYFTNNALEMMSKLHKPGNLVDAITAAISDLSQVAMYNTKLENHIRESISVIKDQAFAKWVALYPDNLIGYTDRWLEMANTFESTDQTKPAA